MVIFAIVLKLRQKLKVDDFYCKHMKIFTQKIGLIGMTSTKGHRQATIWTHNCSLKQIFIKILI